MLIRRMGSAVLCAGLLILAAASAGAGNLLVNRDFDVDLTGWTSIGQWDPADGTSLPVSGSVQWTNTVPNTSGSMFASQCVELTGGGPPALEARAWLWIPTGQAGTGYAQLGLWFYDGPDCVGSPIASHAQQFDVLGPWTEVVLPVPTEHLVAPSVRVWVSSQKIGADDFQVYADHLWFGPPLIFDDGLEHGTTGMWSTTLP